MKIRGRFGWDAHYMKLLDWPVRFRSMPGLFDVPDELLATSLSLRSCCIK
jgi:hypothetical protein